MTIEIRDGRREEREALEALQRQSSRIWEDHRADVDAHPDAIVVEEAWFEAGAVRVAEIEGRVAGFSVVLPAQDLSSAASSDLSGPAAARETFVLELDGLFVAPDLLRHGVGRALLEDAFARARAAGSTAMTVVANENALRFYEKLGFVVTGTAETRFGPAPTMRREL